MRRLWIAGVLVAVSFVAGTHAVSAGQAHARPALVLKVHAGDTLWTIAERLSPKGDPREIVDRLITVNHLGSATIVPGQTLSFPAP